MSSRAVRYCAVRSILVSAVLSVGLWTPAFCAGQEWPSFRGASAAVTVAGNPTAATNGEVVVAFFGAEGLHCYGVQGNLIEWLERTI